MQQTNIELEANSCFPRFNREDEIKQRSMLSRSNHKNIREAEKEVF